MLWDQPLFQCTLLAPHSNPPGASTLLASSWPGGGPLREVSPCGANLLLLRLSELLLLLLLCCSSPLSCHCKPVRSTQLQWALEYAAARPAKPSGHYSCFTYDRLNGAHRM